jgi:A/G-specific adenine glycosylase
LDNINEEISTEFESLLIEWWQKNKRQFPWRLTRAPYEIMVAEILLHRTKAEQVSKVYSRFLASFPTINSVAEANYEEIHYILKELGLNWRIELLYKMAQEIIKKHNGKIPQTKEALKTLPGISDYIASAIACFAFNKSEPLLDTNIVRILGRIFSLKVTDSSRRSNHFKLLYQSINSKENPREFAFAMIDLGALVCLPSRPLCCLCPVNVLCAHYLHPAKETFLQSK